MRDVCLFASKKKIKNLIVERDAGFANRHSLKKQQANLTSPQLKRVVNCFHLLYNTFVQACTSSPEKIYLLR